MTNTCLLCLESTDNIIISEICNCKFILHNDCFDLIKKNGLACPICRLKITNLGRAPVLPNTLHPYFLNFPEYLFLTSPNFLTFILFVIWSYIVTIVYVLPYLLYTVTKTYFTKTYFTNRMENNNLR